MAAKARLRDPSSKIGSRFDTQQIHGFRKFFNKTCKEGLSGDVAAMLIRAEYMMGYKGLVALVRNYFQDQHARDGRCVRKGRAGLDNRRR